MTEQQLKGITTKEAKLLQEKFGKNELLTEKKETLFHKILNVIKEPMFLLLLVAALIYFILGEPKDGAIMLVFVVGIISIETIQECKTDKTLKALKDLSAPHIKVLRDGIDQVINSCDLVPGDIMYISEGIKVPADGIIIKSSTLSIDESSLTGEAEPVWKIPNESIHNNCKDDYWRKDYCYAGTLVILGTATILVDKIGCSTEYGKIGKDVLSAPDCETPLQKQTSKLVKFCALIAAFLFLTVAIVTYFNISDHNFVERIIESILSGVTLAMAMIPEEFPVILTVFLSMGAWRLAKKHSLVRKLPSVETLGSVSVLCVDKTGTITMNEMKIQSTWSLNNDDQCLIKVMGMGCKSDAYDPMEKSMISYACENGFSREELFSRTLIKEYAFNDELKIMGHLWSGEDNNLLAAKGSPEGILPLCSLTYDEMSLAKNKLLEMSKNGLRVIAVAQTEVTTPPNSLSECSLKLCGLIGLADPPREGIKYDIDTCVKAGIKVVMITGDNGVTASSIGKQINMPNFHRIMTGNELSKMSDDELKEKVLDVNIFSRVIPEHKMRIVKAFQENGEIVAMTGDGVNDAPALKHADIGIAMGKRGSEVSREAADLILLDDNFSTIVETIKDGRRIYDNIRKAVGYVFTIHIPIAFGALFAPLLGISPSNLLLLPLHVVLLELVIDPTCSIVLERQPSEDDIMNRPPRKRDEKLLTAKILTKSLLQGVVLFAASFITYLIFLNNDIDNPTLARTMGISIILFGNMLLVHVNSSDTDFFFKSFRKLLKDKVMLIVTFGTVLGILVMLYTPFSDFLKLTPLSPFELFISFCISVLSVLWYELVKLYKFLKY